MFPLDSGDESTASCWQTPELLYLPKSKHLSPRILSHGMTHAAIMYEVVDKNHDFALILEDDVEFMTSFESSLLLFLTSAPPGRDFIFLSECYPGMTGKLWGGFEEVPRLWRMPYARCSDGFLVSQLGARKVLESLPLRTVYDIHLNYINNKPSAFYWADPFIIKHNNNLPSLLTNSAGIHE